MTTFTPHPLYGGAITTLLPSTSIDASNLRQIPDHQEVFLSPTSLSTIIFEINQFIDSHTASTAATTTTATAGPQSQPSTGLASGSGSGSGSSSPSPTTSAAALYHMSDLLASGDALIETSAPQAVALQSASLSGVEAAVVRARIESPVSMRPVAGGQGGAESKATTSVRLLLVRLERHKTDLCVAVNVPWRELGRDGGNGKVQEEERWAEEVLKRVGESLEVLDFGLFGE